MTGMDLEPDPIVRTALQRLPIPAHTDGFWARLDESLDDGAPPTAARRDERTVVVTPAADDPSGVDEPGPALVPAPDPALALVPPALRRPSNGVLLAVAAAAAVVVGLAGASLLDSRDDTPAVTSDEVAQPTAALDDAMDDAQPQAGAGPEPISEAGVDASSEAVLAWVEDLGTGDGAAAWQAMGAASQEHFGSQDAFESEMSSLAEGYGAWSEAEPEDVLVTPVLSDADGTLAVVTLVGTVDQEGATQRRADAFPVRIADGEAVLEPFALAGGIEVVAPAGATPQGDGSLMEADEELVVVVPSDVEAPILRLDDGDTVVCGQADGTELTALEGASGQRCAYLPPDGLAPGEHTLTMAFVGADGTSISAGSVLFDAA
jgi:hypothetical protein